MKNKFILVLIIILAFTLRFWNLGNYPALNADEASNSYDAYSLITTGMDQHGHRWPITFQSFNDYKPGLYVYLNIPFIKLLGLNAWSARIPGALAGVLTVLVIYLLSNELFRDKRFRIFGLSFGIWPALMLTISPWHIHFSRGGWEVNVATFFIALGLLYFVKFIKNPGLKPVILSVLFFVLSMYDYHAARVTTPLLGLCLLMIYRDKIFVKSNTKNLIVGVVFGILIMLPLVHDLLSPGALSRVSGVGLFADQGPINRINEQRGEYANINNKVGKLLHNKIVNYTLAFGNNYLTHFNGEFLFMSGDSIERNKVPETGEMYLFDILLLALGFVYVAQYFSENRKPFLLVIFWLFLAPVASSLTFQSPNALRSSNMVIPLVIICSFGLLKIIEMMNSPGLRKQWRMIGYSALFFVTLWNFTRYLNMYYVHMSKLYPYSSQYGVQELVKYIQENGSKYTDIYITNRYDQPYVLFLFYQKYQPQKFQFHHTLTSRDEFGFSTVSDYDKYHFGTIDFDFLKNNYPNSLIIGTPAEIPQTSNIIKRIYGTNGFEYFDIVEN